MFNSGVTRELWDSLRKFSALEARTDDVLKEAKQLNDKFDNIIERIARLEKDIEHMRTGLKNEILADIKADLLKTKFILDLQSQGILPTISSNV